MQVSLCFLSQQPVIWLKWNFVCIYNVISQSYHKITSSWYEAILATQIKVKGQISLKFVLYLKSQFIIWLTWNVLCIGNLITQSYYIITPTSYKAILAIQIKVKGKISLCFVSPEPIIWLTWNFVCLGNLITPIILHKKQSWYESILVMQIKVKVQISLCFVSQEPWVYWNPNSSCKYILCS